MLSSSERASKSASPARKSRSIDLWDRVFPAFQFREGDVLPGMAEVLAALETDSPFVALSFLLSENSEFDGKSARELLEAGDVEPVLAEARVFLSHGA
jgi:hypothetical protein